MNRVLTKIKQDNKEFLTSEELKKYCKDLYFNYRIISNYLISRGYLINIIDNIYYVKSLDEINKKKLKYSVLELVAKALENTYVTNWYYGFYTALKLMNINYKNQDEFVYLINDKILKNKPIKILGKRFRFLNFKNSFFNFGLINGKIRYSDLEKTILDFLYLWESNHTNENRILIELSKLLEEGISEDKILEYAQYYPKSNKRILENALNQSKIIIR
ncbi:MAG: hypothetical protein ACFFEN_16345 [Candidatus Thorarchaeota archaeon]